MKLVRPFPGKELSISLQEECAEGQVGARTLVMADAGVGLAHDGPAMLANAHAEVGVDEIGRVEALIEPANVVPGFGPHEQ